MFWLTLTLALQAAGQQGPGESLPPTATTLRTAAVRQLVDEYRSGDADAAVAEAARRIPSSLGPLFLVAGEPAMPSAPGRAGHRLTLVAQALLLTEAGMRREHFGRYAASERDSALMQREHEAGPRRRALPGSLLQSRARPSIRPTVWARSSPFPPRA
jgi:hypothetical protein